MQRTDTLDYRGGVFAHFPDNLSERAREHSLCYKIDYHPALDWHTEHLPRRHLDNYHETIAIFPVFPLLSRGDNIFIPYGEFFASATPEERHRLESLNQGFDQTEYDHYRTHTNPLPSLSRKSAGTLNYRRMNEGEELGEAMARVYATRAQTSTRLEMVAGVAASDELRAESVLEHVILRIRRVTAIFADDVSASDLGFEDTVYEDSVYQYTIAQFINQRSDPAPFNETLHGQNKADRLWWLNLWKQLWSTRLRHALRVRARARHQGLDFSPIVWYRIRRNQDIPDIPQDYVDSMNETRLESFLRDDGECCICQQPYSDDDPMIILDCQGRHRIGATCMREWITSRFDTAERPCPVCRDRLPNAEVYRPWEMDGHLEEFPRIEQQEHFGIAGVYTNNVAATSRVEYFKKNPCLGMLGQLPFRDFFRHLMLPNDAHSTVNASWRAEEGKCELTWDLDYPHRYRRAVIFAIQLRRAMRRLPDGTVIIKHGDEEKSMTELPSILQQSDWVWAERERGAWSIRKFELHDKFSSFRPSIDDLDDLKPYLDVLIVTHRLSHHFFHLWETMRSKRLLFEGLNRVLAGTEDLWAVLDHFSPRGVVRGREEDVRAAVPDYLCSLAVPQLATRLRWVRAAREIPTEDPKRWALALTQVMIECDKPRPGDAHGAEDDDEPDTKTVPEVRKLGKTEPTKNKVTKPAGESSRKAMKDALRLLRKGGDGEGKYTPPPEGNFYELIWLCLGLKPCDDNMIRERWLALRKLWRRRGWIDALDAMYPSRHFIMRRAADLYTIISTLLDDPDMCEPPFYHDIATRSPTLISKLLSLQEDPSIPYDEQVAILNSVADDITCFTNGSSRLCGTIPELEDVESPAATFPNEGLFEDILADMEGTTTHDPEPEADDAEPDKQPPANAEAAQQAVVRAQLHPNPLRDDTFVYSKPHRLIGDWYVHQPRQPVKRVGLDELLSMTAFWTYWLAYDRHHNVLLTAVADGGQPEPQRYSKCMPYRHVFARIREYYRWLDASFKTRPRNDQRVRLSWL